MNHLQALRTLNLAMAALMGVFALLFLAVMGIPGILAIQDGKHIGWLFVIAALGSASLLGTMSVMHLRVARSVAAAKQRILQTSLATMHMLNFPIGTAYAAYTLWVCWFNEETKVRFDVSDGPIV